MIVYAAPNFTRAGVIGGFVLGGVLGDWEPGDVSASSLVPTITQGALFAQGTLYRPGGSAAAVATGSLSLTINLDARVAVSSTFTVSDVPVYDSLGNVQAITFTFTKAAADTWDVVVSISAGALVLGGGTQLATGVLGFSGGGELISPVAGAPIPIHIVGLLDGAAEQWIAWSLYWSGGPLVSQISADSSFTATLQDGQTASLPGPPLPAAPASQRSWLWWNSAAGFYWTATPAPTIIDDAFLGWVVTDATDILAVSRQVFWVVASTGVAGSGSGASGGRGGTGSPGTPTSAPPVPAIADWVHESPAGARDGTNKTFSLSWIPAISTHTQNPICLVFGNREQYHPFSWNAVGYSTLGGEYSLLPHSKDIVFRVPPPPDTQLAAFYPPTDEAPPAPLRTGLWFSNAAAGFAYQGEIEYMEYSEVFSLNADRGVYGVQSVSGGASALTKTGGRDYGKYPHVLSFGLQAAPNVGSTVPECAIAYARYSHVPSASLGYSTAWITVGTNPDYQYGIWGMSWSSGHSDLADSGAAEAALQVFGAPMEGTEGDMYSGAAPWYKDTLQNSIPTGLMGYVFNFTIWHSLTQGPTPSDAAVLEADDATMLLFFPSIRINCGDTRSISTAQHLFPGYPDTAPYGTGIGWIPGTWAWLTDQAFTGGALYDYGSDPGGLQLFRYGRQGTEFQYVFGRNLFADQYPQTAYELSFGFFEWEEKVVGQRVFSVLASSDGVTWTPLITDLDVRSSYGTAPSEVRGQNVVIDSYPDGKLYIKFVASVGKAICSYIRVTPRWL